MKILVENPKFIFKQPYENLLHRKYEFQWLLKERYRAK